MGKKIIVTNVSDKTNEVGLRVLFSSAGFVGEVTLQRDGTEVYAVIEMGSDKDAANAIQKFNGYNLDGNSLIVNQSGDDNDRMSKQTRHGGFADRFDMTKAIRRDDGDTSRRRYNKK